MMAATDIRLHILRFFILSFARAWMGFGAIVWTALNKSVSARDGKICPVAVARHNNLRIVRLTSNTAAPRFSFSCTITFIIIYRKRSLRFLFAATVYTHTHERTLMWPYLAIGTHHSLLCCLRVRIYDFLIFGPECTCSSTELAMTFHYYCSQLATGSQFRWYNRRSFDDIYFDFVFYHSHFQCFYDFCFVSVVWDALVHECVCVWSIKFDSSSDVQCVRIVFSFEMTSRTASYFA